MKKRKLGYSDLELTPIGLGTWSFGGEGWDYSWGPQEDEKSIKTVHQALDAGINWIDTAAVYGLGHSEKVVGRAIKDLSERPIIATKCSRVWDDNGRLGHNLKADNVKRECEASLKRLQVDVIDLYQIHWPKPDEDIEEGWQAIAELIEEGKVRYGGVSNFSVEQMQRAQSIHPIASLQPPYSMIVPDIENEILPFCAENNIGVVVYSPMYKGLLAGKMSHERLENMPDTDHRKRDPQFQGEQFNINLALVDGLHGIAENRGITTAQLVPAWVLRRPEVTSAIAGGRSPQQIQETVQAASIELDSEEIEMIDVLLKKRRAALNRL